MTAEPQGEKLWAQVLAADMLGELRFVLPPTKQRKSPPVRQHVRAGISSCSSWS